MIIDNFKYFFIYLNKEGIMSSSQESMFLIWNSNLLVYTDRHSLFVFTVQPDHLRECMVLFDKLNDFSFLNNILEYNNSFIKKNYLNINKIKNFIRKNKRLKIIQSLTF